MYQNGDNPQSWQVHEHLPTKREDAKVSRSLKYAMFHVQTFPKSRVLLVALVFQAFMILRQDILALCNELILYH